MNEIPPPQLSPDLCYYWDGTTWVSLLSEDASERWDGQKWVSRRDPAELALAAAAAAAAGAAPDPDPATAPVAVQAAAPAPVRAAAAPGRSISRTWIIIAALAIILLMLLVSGAFRVLHLTGFVQQTGASSVSDLAAEHTYNALFSRDMTIIQNDSVPYAPTSAAPGVCNKGGSKQVCLDTDQKMTSDFRAMLADLHKSVVPPRYKKADTDLRAGLQLNIDAISLRDGALGSADPNASLAPSNQVAQRAADMLHQAYNEFPADNAPLPKL